LDAATGTPWTQILDDGIPSDYWTKVPYADWPLRKVPDALIKAGVPADKILTGSFGESRLICNQATEECWQRDRRVEVLISTSK
jgi:hypothetical protein